MKIRMILGCVLTWLACIGPAAHALEQVYMQADDFVASAFPARTPQAQALWITQELRQELAEQFGWQAGLRAGKALSADVIFPPSIWVSVINFDGFLLRGTPAE